MTDLLPCPFCGGEAKVKMLDGDPCYKVVICLTCYACTQPIEGLDAATSVWNTRANPELDSLKARVRGWKSRLSNNFRHDTCCPDDCWSHIFSVIDEMREVTG